MTSKKLVSSTFCSHTLSKKVEEEILEEEASKQSGGDDGSPPLTEETASELAEELGIETMDLTTMNPPDDIMVGNMTGPDPAAYEAAMAVEGEPATLGSSTVDAEEGIGEESAVANETAIHLKSDVDGVGSEEVSASAPTATTETQDVIGEEGSGSTVNEATSAPLKMDDEEERPPATTEAPEEGETELTTVLPTEGGEEIIADPTEPSSEGQETTTGATTTEGGPAATTEAPPAEEIIQTGAPTPRPTYQYVEPADEEDDPLASSALNVAFENGDEVSPPSDDDNYRGKTDDFYRHEEEEVRKVGTGLTLGALVLMVYTAYQMSENPDGICAR